MNPLAKAVGTVLLLAAGALGTSLDHGLQLLPLPHRSASEGDALGGNETGNQTGNATGNQTGNATGNSTGNATGNQTGNATGNQTAGNSTAGNQTADPDPADGVDDPAVCSFAVDEWGNDLTPRHHEWEWLVNEDVTSLSVEFYTNGGLPMGFGSHPEARLIDGGGRTLARTTDDGALSISLERGSDYLASGPWRLVFDSSDAFADYYASVHLAC